MKKIIFVTLLTLTAFTVYSQTGIIREFTGDVALKPEGASAFVPAEAGSQVAQNTIVSTGFKSIAIIAVGSSVIMVRPLTRLSLAEISSANNTENLNVNLQTGRVRVEVRPPAGTRANATVQSPTATASVRGTEFEMDASNISVINGTVAWQGSDGLSAMVQGGSSSTVVDGGAVNPAELAASDLLPSAPVGAGSSGKSGSSSGESGTVLELILEYN
jgi:hypothetical protein